MGKVAFAVFLWAVGLVGILAGRSISGVGGWIPMGAAAILLLLATAVISVDLSALIRSRRQATRAVAVGSDGNAVGADTATDGRESGAEEHTPADAAEADSYGPATAMGYVGAAVILYFLFGPVISMGLSVLVFGRFYGSRGWLHTVVVAGLSAAATYLLLDLVAVQHYQGIVTELAGINV